MRKLMFWIAGMIFAGLIGVPCHADNPPFWNQEDVSVALQAWSGHALAYDAAHGQIVRFGGLVDGLDLLNTTWVWDGVSWKDVTPGSVPNPRPRLSPAMAYDAAHDQVVLFGGGSFQDTWVWDGVQWTNVTPASNNPPARLSHAMAFDAAHGQVVLFGGWDTANTFNDTWVWNGKTWANVTPATITATNNPAARQGHAMAYDAAHGQVVLFGGSDASGIPLNDTWVWNGANWTQANPGTKPPTRSALAMAYDGAHNQVILFGGAQGATVLNDTWAWNGSNWIQESPSTTPPARDFHAMAYDARHDQVVLFGGSSSSDFHGTLNDTWAWTHGIFASAGNPQSAAVGTRFSFPLEVTVVDNNSIYVSGAQVTFSGPANMVSFSSSTAMTGTDGRAHVTATATSNAGSYNVTASLNGSTDFALFTLSNVNTANATGLCQVTTGLDDNSSGSLRSQVATCGKGGTITFAGGLTRAVVSQLQDIQLTQDLTINGGTGVTIDAGSTSRIFFMFGGNIDLANLTLQNGVAKGGNGGNGALGAGGGAAGMGGAVFVNGGTLSIGSVNFTNNQASGGNGGNGGGLASAGGGGGMGGDGGAGTFQYNNGGGGGDFGLSGGTGADGSGGAYPNNVGGGFGAGGAVFGSGGFGGGSGGHDSTNHASFGGIGSTTPDAGGGAGLGGAIFLRNGSMTLTNASFSFNRANRGLAGSASANDGQGKGGALFIYSGATAAYFGSLPTFMSDAATDAAMGTDCSSVVGSGALDTKDVCGVLLLGQTISFGMLSDRVYGSGSFNVSATATSGLSVSFSSLTTSVCTVTSAGSVSLVAVGLCSIQALQSGNATYAAAAPVSQSFHILQASQTITFGPLGDQISGAAPFGLSATATSGLSVGFASTTPSVCTVSGTTVGLVAVGLCSIQATQAGNTNYSAATPVVQSFHVVANVSAQVQVTQNGFARNRSTGLWAATMTVTNTSGATINGPIQVAITSLSSNATMTNQTGVFNATPYITVSAGALGAGGSASVIIQFANPSSGFITFTPVTYSGAF